MSADSLAHLAASLRHAIDWSVLAIAHGALFAAAGVAVVSRTAVAVTRRAILVAQPYLTLVARHVALTLARPVSRAFLIGCLVTLLVLRLFGADHVTVVHAAERPATATAFAVDPNRFVDPLPSGHVTLPFGPTDFALEAPLDYEGHHYAHFHKGVDLAAKRGTPVVAAAAGVVIEAGANFTGAVVVRVRHIDGSVAEYGHLGLALPVKRGDVVAAGQLIGSVDSTGFTTGPHLHFGLWIADKPIDPVIWLNAGHLPLTH
jgi:murein DD-endopeptidase MepM/ murein hydrolase activator NlpD